MQTLPSTILLGEHRSSSLERSIGLVGALACHALLIGCFVGQKTFDRPELKPGSGLITVSLIPANDSAPESSSPTQADRKASPASTKPESINRKARQQRMPAPVAKSAKSRPLIDASNSLAESARQTEPFSPSASAESAPADDPAPAPAPITPPRFNASYLDNPSPDYPAQSRSEGEEGRVVLRVFVSAQGSAEQVEIRKSSGFHRLDESARVTVGHWRFVPAHRAGEPVAAWVNVPITFSLEG